MVNIRYSTFHGTVELKIKRCDLSSGVYPDTVSGDDLCYSCYVAGVKLPILPLPVWLTKPVNLSKDLYAVLRIIDIGHA